jgi:hypothetical protein
LPDHFLIFFFIINRAGELFEESLGRNISLHSKIFLIKALVFPVKVKNRKEKVKKRISMNNLSQFDVY